MTLTFQTPVGRSMQLTKQESHVLVIKLNHRRKHTYIGGILYKHSISRGDQIEMIEDYIFDVLKSL